MTTMTVDDLVLIDVRYYMLGSIYLEDVLDKVVAANSAEVVRLYWQQVVIEDVAEHARSQPHMQHLPGSDFSMKIDTIC